MFVVDYQVKPVRDRQN